MLDRLESFASYEIGRRILSASGSFRLFNRDAHVDAALARQEVIFFETLEGLEARVGGQGVAILRDYRTYKQKAVRFCSQHEIPKVLRFEPLPPVRSPRIAVANRP